MNIKGRRLGLVVCLLGMLFFAPSYVGAEEKIFSATSQYLIRRTDSIQQVEQAAIEDVRRLAVEQSGTYIVAMTELKNQVVIQDEVKSVAMGVAKLLPESIIKDYQVMDKSGTRKLTLTASFVIDVADVMHNLQMIAKRHDAIQATKKVVIDATERALASGIAKEKAKKYDAAILEYKEILRIWPKYAVAYYRIGLCNLEVKTGENYGENLALWNFEKALKLDPSLDEVWFRLSQLLRKWGNVEEAEADLRKAIALNPAWHEVRQQEIAEKAAKEDAEKQERLKEEQEWEGKILFLFAIHEYTRNDVRDFQGALDYINVYIDSGRFLALAYCERAHIHYLLGDRKQYKMDLEKAYMLDPDIDRKERKLRESAPELFNTFHPNK